MIVLAAMLATTCAGSRAMAQDASVPLLVPSADASVMSAELPDASRSAPDAGATEPHAEADPTSRPPAVSGDDATAEAADDSAATRALGSDDADIPDPVAEEGERTGSAEGEPLSNRSDVAGEIAALSDRACLRALQRAHVPFERVQRVIPGVAQAIRITGPINGVTYHASDRNAVHELMDCRLAVALVRFSRMLRRLAIVEVRHYSTYRVPGTLSVLRRPIQSRHGGGLAIDAAWFIREDGTRVGVERDFHGRRERPVCGPEARVPHNEAARLLRTIACDAGRLGIFHVILTPNWNYAHRNHFHMEVTRGVQWQFVH